MREVKIKCDRCDKEITESETYKVTLPCKETVSLMDGDGKFIKSYTTDIIHLDKQDLCTDCTRELLKFMEEKKEI